MGDDSKYYIVGMIDDDPAKHGLAIRGVRVRGGFDSLSYLVNKHNIQQIVIAIPSATILQRRELISKCVKTGCKVKMMPYVSDLDDAQMTSLKNIDVNDLLGRENVVLDPKKMSDYLSGKTVLVTGGGGSIGSELCRQIIKYHPSVIIIYDSYENNAYDLLQELRSVYQQKSDNIIVKIGSVQDKKRLNEVFSEFKPSIVFHAAAYKHVPLMEECPEIAVYNNVFGSYNVAVCSERHHVRHFVMISTDKAVNPTNVMGATKRLSEMLVQSLNGKSTRFSVVRFGNVLGSNGSVVPIFRRQIEIGGPVTVTHPEITRFFMTIPEAAQLVLQACTLAEGGEAFILDMGEPVKILDLAKSMIEMAGLEPETDIPIIFTGLRPGEKLYEELLLDAQNAKKTMHNKIFVEYLPEISIEERRRILDRLSKVVSKNGDVKTCLRELLPAYTPMDDEPQAEAFQEKS